MESFNLKLISIVILFAVAVGITALAKKLNRSSSTALVGSGLIIGAVHIPQIQSLYNLMTQSAAFPIIILSIFLPTLLGEATLSLPVSHLMRNKRSVLILALLGTLLTYIFVGLLSYYIMGLSLVVAMVFGALMSTTDPISVISVLKSKGINRQLSTILEGESLFNDGIGVVLFNMSVYSLLAWLQMGWGGLGQGILMFSKFAMGGALVGGLLGFLFSHLTKLFDDYPLEIAFSILLFFGSYFLAEEFNVSGVIAVAISGLIFGSYGASIGMTPLTKMTIRSFWEVISFIANALIFFMLGLQINHLHLEENWPLIIPAILIVLVARSLAVYFCLAFEKMDLKWKHLINIGGLKGSLSVALALSLPANFSGRETIQVLTFGVVIFSLLIQSWSLDPLLKFLRLAPSKEPTEALELALIKINTSHAVLGKLEDMHSRGQLDAENYEGLKRLYQADLHAGRDQVSLFYSQFPEIKKDKRKEISRQLLATSYHTINDLLNRELISEKVGMSEKHRLLLELEQNRRD